MPRNAAIAAVAVALMSNGASAQPSLPDFNGACAVVPMLPANIPVVEVMIGDKGPYRFAIDTGAQGNGRISPQVAAELGLEPIGEVRTPAPGGTLATRPIFGLPELSVGGVELGNLAMVALSDARGPDNAWDGILGNDLLQILPVTLDYGHSLVRFGGPPPQGAFMLRFDRGVPILPIAIGEQTFAVDFDSGNGAGALFLTEEDAKALPLTGDPVERGKARTSFGEFSIMEAPLADPVTVEGVVLPVKVVGWPTPRPTGNLGSKAMAGMTITIDAATAIASVQKSQDPTSCTA